MATETQIPEFVCLKSCETEDNAWSSELPGNKVKQLETVNTEVETGKLTNESGTFLQALSDPMVNAGQHSKIPESCEATTIQYQEEEKNTNTFTEAVSTQTEAGKEETVENEEKKAIDSDGVTRSEDAVFEDIIKETTDGQDAATEFLKEETEDKVIDAQKASEECEIGAKEKEEEKAEEIEQEEEIAEMGPSVKIEEKLDEKEEKTDSPLIKEVTVSEKTENQEEVNMLEKEQGEKDATFAQDVTLEKADNEEVKTKESREDETEEIGNIIEKPEQINVIHTDVYISTQAEPVQDAEDKSIDAQEASKPYEDGTNNNGEQKPEEDVDKIVESCLKLEQDEYKEIKPTVEKIEESQLKTAELEEGVNGSQKENLENLSIKEVSEERDTKTESFTEAKSNDDEDAKAGQDATMVADCKERDLNEEPREFLLEESEVKLTHVQQASEECENEAKEKGEENPEDSVKKSEKEEEIAEIRPIVEETGSEKAENHEIVSKNEDGEKEQEQDVNAVTDEIIEEESKVDAENQADKTQDKIEMKDEVISTDKASEECEIGAKEKEEEKPEETVEKSEQEEEIVEIGSTVEKSDTPLVKEVTEETVPEVIILKKDDGDQEKEQEVNILEKEQGERDATFAQDHSEDTEQQVVKTKESIEEETEEIRNITEKPEQINEEPKQENKEAEDKSIDAQEASEQYEDGTNNKGEQEPVEKIVDSCLELEQEEYKEEIKPTVEETQVKTAELEEEVNGSQKENLSIKEVSEETNTKTESFAEAKSIDDEVATFEGVKETLNGQDATIVADFKEQDLNEESREFLLEETEDKLTHVQEASEECENEAKDNVKKSEKEEEIAEIRPIVEESGSEKAEKQEVVNMLEKEEDEEKEQEVNILEKDQDVIPTDVCISTQSDLKEEPTEIEEKNDEEVIDGQTNKSEILLVKEICDKEQNEDEEKEQQLLMSEKGQDDVTSSQNASKEDISIDAQETTEQYEDEANNKEEEIGVNKIVDSCSKVEQEEYTEELKPTVEESQVKATELVEEITESDGGQMENPSIKEESELENIKSEVTEISDNLGKDKDEEKEQELNMSEQDQKEDNVTCSEMKEEAIEIGEKNDDDQEQSEIPLVNETITSEKVEFEQATEHTDNFVTELESNEIVKKEENLEMEQEHDVNTVTEELIEDKLVDTQEMSSELQQPTEENVEEIQACLTETISEKTEDDITKTGQDLSHEKVEDTNDSNTEEEKMVVDGRTREIEISTLEHEPVEEQKCGLDEVSKENLTDLNETIAVQEDITVSNSLETSTEDIPPIDDFTSVSQVQIPQVVPTSEECVTADTTVHVDEEKETTKEEISRDDNVLTELKEKVNVPENLLIKDVSEEIESKSERVELSDSLTKDKDVTSIEDLQTKNDDTRENVDEDTEEEIKSVVEIEEDAETKPSEEITEIGEENDGGQKKSETSSEKAEFQQLTEHSDSLGMELDKNKIVSKEQEQNVNVTSDEKDKSEQKPDDTVNEPVNSCPEIVEEYIKEDEADAENQADKADEKVEMKDEVISTEKVSLELEQENVIEDVTKIEDTNDNTKEEKIFETREIEISTLDHESVSKEKFTDLNETTAVEPQEDIMVSDSLETSEKVKTDSEIDDVESVFEVVPTSDESNMKEECLISETTGCVDKEKETVTESDEKAEIKQKTFTEVCEETSLEKEESEGLELSDSSNVEQNGLLNVITSSTPTESKEETTENEEKSEDIENDGQINKAEQVCEVTSLEVEDRSIDGQEVEPQEDITVSDSLEISEKVKTESESLPTDGVKSVSEVVTTSDESNLKEECLTSETKRHVDEEKEIETESDEKTEIKQETFTEVCEETSLEKAESEGLELSDSSNVEQQGLLNVITSSAPTESKEETTENDGQINKAEIPLAEQVCEVASLEEDRSIDAQECENEANDKTEQIPEESVVEENIKETEADEGDNKEIKAKLDADNQADRTQDTSDIKDGVISAQKMSSELERPNEENVIGDRILYVTKLEEEEEKISTLDHGPETTATKPQEDITVSDSLETSTKDTFSSDKVRTESESLPIDDVESVEVVPTSDESNLKEDISETTGRVIEEKETVTESDEKTDIKQETSLEKAELEGLKLSDVDQQGLLDVITSSEPTESKEEKSEDIENDGQIKKAEIPLVEQVCEVTSLEVEDRSVEIPEESVEENIKENEADAGDKTQDTSEMKDEVISMSAELEQPKEENVEAEIITEKTEDPLTKNDDQEKIEDTNDNNTTEEEKIFLDEKTREFEISEHVEEQNCFDQVSKENFTDLNETAAVESTSNSDKEKTESESLSTNDLETVSEVQIPKVGPVSEVSNQKEECLVSATTDVTEHVEKEDTGDHKLEDPETENSWRATQETSEPDETETKLDAENQVERTEGSEIKDEVITAVKVDEEIHAYLTATKSESTEDEITKEDEEKCIVDGKAREIEISTIEQEPVEEKNSGVDEVLTETAVETQEDITVSDSLETSTKDTLDSEKAKTESENSQKDDLEEQIPEVVPTLEESKVNKEYLTSETATHVDEEKETVTLSDETTEIMQETSAGLEEFVKTKESVDEDTKEIKSSVETNEIESESPLIKEVCESTSSDNIEPKDSDSFSTKLDENEIVNKTTEATIEILGEETEDKSYDAQEASKKCEDIANDEIEQKQMENVIEENVKEDTEKKDIDDKTEDRSEMKDEVVTTEKIEDEITEKDDNLENAYENTTKGELEHEPVEEQNADLDEEKLTALNEKTAVEPTLAEDTSNSDKAKAESEHLPINDIESVSQVQIPETMPKLEDSATTDYHIDETLEKSYITTEENMPQVDSACEKINIEEDVTQLKSTDDKSEMVQDVILNEEIAYSDPVPAEVAEDAQIGQEGLKAAEDISCENDHVDEALISPSLEDVATIESQVEKLPTRALEYSCDVQTPEVIVDSADPEVNNEISSAPVKSDEEKNDLNKEDKALTIENLELHDEFKPTSEVTIEEQVNELKPQQEQSEKSIINDQTLESKLEDMIEKDFEDGKEDIVTLAPEKQNEIMKNVILTNEVVVETENEKGGNEVKEDNSPTELEYTLTKNKKELEDEVPNFEFEKKEKDDELISQVQTPESILKMEMKEEATNDTCEMVLLEDEKENISINEEAIHNQLPSDTNEVFQIEKLNSSRNETTEDPKSIAENLKLKDETFTDMKRSDEDSETVAAEVEILENVVAEEKIVKTDANKEKETLDEPHEDEAENLPEASIEKHDPEIKTKSEVAEIVPEDRESCSILTENLPEASKEITTTTEKIEKEIENKEREVQESSAQNDKNIEDSLVQPSIEKEIIQDVVRNEEIEQPNLDKTFEFVNQETQKEQADEYMIPIEAVKSSTREFEIPAVMEATADKADNTEDIYNKTVEAEKGVINENKSKPTEEVSGIKQEPLELDAPLTLDTTAKEDLKISQKYVTDDLIKTSQTQPEIQKYDVTTFTVDKQSPTEPQENENNLLTNQIDAKPLTAEVEDFKASEPQNEVIREEKKLSDENKTSESEVVENLIGQRELTLPKDQLVEKEKSGVKSDEENEEEDDDNEKMGSDAPVMVEASKDMEVKVHKKSHNILSGVGSKVKHSIAKVKKAITGGKSSPKSPSPPPKERDQVIT